MITILAGERWRKVLLALVAALCPMVAAGQTTDSLESVLSIADPAVRIVALKRFLGGNATAEQLLRAREAAVASWAESAERELRGNNIERAVTFFSEAIGALPADISDRFFIDTVVRIPQAVSMRGYRAESIVLARQLERRFSGEAGRLAAIGEYYMTIEAPLDAVRTLEAAVRLRAEDAEIRRRLAQAYRLSLRLDDAIHEYQYVIGLNQKEKRGYFELANLYRARGAFRESINLYRAQLEIEPRHSPSWKGLALAQLASGDDAGYGESLTKGRELGDKQDDPALDVYLQSQAALIGLARGRLAAARQAADAAVAIEPRYAWARIAAAEVDLAEGKFFEAERNLLAATEYATFPTLTFTIGKLYLLVEDFDGALERFQKVIELTGNGDFRTLLGGTLAVESGSLRELLEPEHQAAILLAEPPTSTETFQIAESLIRLNHLLGSGKIGDNRARLDQLVDRFLNAERERNVIRALYLANRFSRYPELVSKVMELTDLALEKAEELTQATGSLRDYPNYDRDGRRRIVRGRALDYRGWALYRAGQPVEAEQTLREAIREYGPLPEVRRTVWHLGTVRESAGALNEALDLYIAAYEPPPDTGRAAGRGSDLDRAVIEMLYRRIHGSLDGLDLQLRRGVDLAAIDPTRALSNIFLRPGISAATAPALPERPVDEVKAPPAKGLEKANLTARITLPLNDPIFTRPLTSSPAVSASETATASIKSAPTPRLPVVLPAAVPGIVITDPLTPFFNQQRYYSRWDSFRLVDTGQSPPSPRQR